LFEMKRKRGVEEGEPKKETRGSRGGVNKLGNENSSKICPPPEEGGTKKRGTGERS